ncbi:hypothetical protein [Devosia submarina]|uniref:hypothetical protein n=1 Tax=Devosia submarina TaxID=1173082 RepID=UPI000D3A33B9|nr:hypothetical protein [Devosia submarina]
MNAPEIIRAITWAADTDPALKQEVEDAIRRLAGRNRPVYNSIEVHHRLEAFITKHGSANKAAVALGISKSFLHDMRHAKRPYTDDLLTALGMERVRTKDLFSVL